MRAKLLVLMFLILASCATQEQSSVPSDITEAADQPIGDDLSAPGDMSAPPPNEFSEADIASEGASAAVTETTPPPPAVDAPQDPGAEAPTADNLQQETPPAQQAETMPPPPVEEPAAPVANEKPAVVTGLDYKSNINGGTVVIRTDNPVQMTTRKNEQNNQFIIELKNTTLPKKFQRPYITKEFGGNIASINGYQSSGSDRSARIVVQLRGPAGEPQVSQDGNVISVAGAGGSAPSDNSMNVAQRAEPNSQPQESASNNEEVSQNEPSAENTQAANALETRSLSDFLMGGNKFYGRAISIEVKDADIRDVFRFISEESGLNMVVGDDVVGKISLKLKKIPWDQALSVVLQSRQLGYIKQGNILRIASLKNLQLESDEAKKVIDSQRLLETLHVQVFPISYAKSEDLEVQAKDFLSPRGKVKADKRTNALIVTDISESLGKIRKLIQRLDTQTPQVLIEAKVVEARESFSRLIGVNWNFTGNPTQVNNNSQGAAVNFTPRLNSTTIQNNIAGLSTAGFTVGTFDVIGDLSASLALLETESLIKVLSSPRILTLDRVDASIKQTSQVVSFKTTAGTAATPGGVEPIIKDVNLELKVKPQVTNDGAIILEISVTREFPGTTVNVDKASATPINSRFVKTQVLVDNGDTIVIGGIYQSDVGEGESGIPWLRKIPVIGGLFRSRSTSREKNELVIFLTPRTLNREKSYVRGGMG